MFKLLGLLLWGFNLDGVSEVTSLPWLGLLLCLHTGILQGGVKDQGVESRKLVMTGLGEGDSYNFKEMLKN